MINLSNSVFGAQLIVHGFRNIECCCSSVVVTISNPYF